MPLRSFSISQAANVIIGKPSQEKIFKYYKRKWALGEKSSKKEIELTEKAPNTANEEKLDKTEELCDKTLETNQNSTESEIKDTSSATTPCAPNNTPHSENGPSSLPVSPNENAQKKEITKEDFDLSYTTKIISTIILYVLIGVVTILVPQLKTLFNCIGSTAANSISFIIFFSYAIESFCFLIIFIALNSPVFFIFAL